jgi:DNA-directed RNA polymerase subunit H (RpoH/RPB5)
MLLSTSGIRRNPIEKLLVARKVLRQTIEARGYLCPEVEETLHDLEALYVLSKEKLEIEASHKETGKTLLVIFHIDFLSPVGRIGVGIIREYEEKLKASNITECILVVQAGLTPGAQTQIRKLEREKTYIDMFRLDELQFNALNHVDVPKYTKLNNEEKKELLKKYQVSDLPQQTLADKISRLLGLRVGDIVRIERTDFICGIIVWYRYIVDALQ